MRRNSIRLIAGAALSLLVAPAGLAAQDTTPMATTVDEAQAAEFDEAMAMMATLYPAEPLTAEQEARLPQAQRIIARMIPEGTMADMMGSMFDTLLVPLMALGEAPAMDTISKGTGFSEEAISLTPEQAAQIAAMFDPAYAERHKREAALLPALIQDIMTVMEPSVRKAMAELYAVHFSQPELDGIEAFFQTEIGAAYARKSFTMSSDPRIVSATMESMPQMMESFAGMEAQLAAAGEGLPPIRRFNDLSAAEQERVATIMGYSVAEIEAQQQAAE
ncbi:DUF2059 domain-containing protein [Erythrobacter sp. R86502]|uniref:DUF2059 domain-containing protein n=1 Tax=Erythrobacter sp. R86502 TaxID=3093846 RepID=UPI0036D3BBA8